MENNFEAFIISLLNRAHLQPKTISSLMDEGSAVIFRKAFTHKSYDPEFNYEFLEFRGDVVVNLSISQYIRRKFPDVVSMKWLTKIKHNLASKTVLAGLSQKAGFLSQIQYGESIKDILSKPNFEEDTKYISMMEDVFEAFFGALTQIIDSKYHKGVGFAVSYTIISSFLNEIDISLKWEDVFDAKSRLKELYDQLAWGDIDKYISTRKTKDVDQFSTLITFPRGDRDREIIGKGFGPTPQIAQDRAAQKAIQALKRYGIFEKIPSAFIDISSERALPPTIPDGFKEFIVKLLKRARVKTQIIKKFTDDESLYEFRMSLVHSSYDEYINYNLYKFLGIAVVDLSIAEYLGVKFPRIVSEKWLTNIKHNIVSQNIFVPFTKESGFDKFILYGKEMEESIEQYPNLSTNVEYNKMLEGVFKAFMGALVTIIDNKIRKGVGYATAFNFLSSYMNQIPISINYTDVFNHKSRLKELYDHRGWLLKKNIFVNYDEERNVHISTIIGYPKGNKRPIPQNEVVLAIAEGKTKREAEQNSARIAIEKLDRVYNIREIPPDPYQLS